jgi:DNA-binding IclR family transcriptional regulator
MFLRPDESFYLREVVRRTGCGTGSVQRGLKLLTNCGILRRDMRC